MLDIAEVAAKVLTNSGHEGKAYALAGPVALTYIQVAKILGSTIGKPVRYIIPPEAFGQTLRQYGHARVARECNTRLRGPRGVGT